MAYRDDQNARHLSRRGLLKGVAGTAGAASMAGLAGQTAAGQATPSPVASPGASPIAAANAQPGPNGGMYIPSGVEGVPDAWLEPPTPYTSYEGVPGSGGTVRVFTISYNPPPTPRDDNQYWQELERRLGVTWEPIITPQPSYGEKSAALIASGDFPDLFYLNPGQNAAQQNQAMAQGAFLDLTPYVTGDALQGFRNLATIPQFMWDNVKFQGKIFGVPKPLWRNGNLPFYRGDWAATLGMDNPSGPQAIGDMLRAFTSGDPNGNGQADTWGAGRFNNGWTTWDNLIANQMHKVPNNWRVNDDGTLTAAIETEEFRAALEYLQALYADGGFHPDAAGMTFADAQNAYIAGNTGLHYEGFLSFYGPTSVTGRAQEVTPEATSTPIIPVAADGSPGVVYNEIGYFGFTGIPVAVGDDEERIQELLRILDYLCSPFGSEEANFLGSGLEGTHHERQENGALIGNDLLQTEKGDLLGIMGGLAVYFYPETPELAIEIQQIALQATELGIDDPTLSLFSETNVDQGATLAQLGQDTTSAIVTGRQPIDSLDAALDEWRSRGGDQIRQDYQTALQEQGG